MTALSISIKDIYLEVFIFLPSITLGGVQALVSEVSQGVTRARVRVLESKEDMEQGIGLKSQASYVL